MSARFPPWLKKPLTSNELSDRTRDILAELRVQTVCQRARCPNLPECFSRERATFLILGDICTRGCRFCAVRSGEPSPPDRAEPARVARAAERLGLRHVVITSVTRDDLPDHGARHFARTIRSLKSRLPQARIEVLVPDFGGRRNSIDVVIEAGPDIFNHNVETVPRLYKEIRQGADYGRSMRLLELAKKRNSMIYTKSGLMVGLGEEEPEVYRVMEDLRDAGCDCLTIGQYLRPSSRHYPVCEFIHPDKFKRYEARAYELAFIHVASGPFVRSSYHAEEVFGMVS